MTSLRLEVLLVVQMQLRALRSKGGTSGLEPERSDHRGFGPAGHGAPHGALPLELRPDEEPTATTNRLWLYEIERAIDELADGCPNSHTETVERWANAFLAAKTGSAA
jgi:hypothetical protein